MEPPKNHQKPKIHPEKISWKNIIYSSWQIHPKLKIDQNVTYALFALNHSIMNTVYNTIYYRSVTSHCRWPFHLSAKIFYVHMFIVISITDGPMILTPFLSELILWRARRWGLQKLHLTCCLQVGPVKRASYIWTQG